jgi:hypothetical protein
VIAAALARPEGPEDAILVAEILGGRSARTLPATVAAALQRLELASSRHGRRHAVAGEAGAR